MSQQPPSLWRRSVAVALVALMAGVLVAPILHGGAGHDSDCDPVVVVHDAAQHRFSAPPQTVSPQTDNHCVACHVHRAPRGAVSWELSGLRPLEASDLLRSTAGAISLAPARARVPARAPPAIV